MKKILPLIAVGRKRVFLGVFAITVLFAAPEAVCESKHFPVPDIIKPNVAFWIRIYTEVGLKEGLLHDRDYPQIVYEKIASGDMTGKARSEHIDGRRKIYVSAIAAVKDSAPEKWGVTEKRVAEMFKTAPEGALEDAENRIRHQTGQRERFKQGLERSSMHLDTIAAILKQHGVPDELKYLPHVESSFDAEAYSKVGAAGLWQFMRATGRGYMKIDYMFDERRDPIISTYAAAKFMRTNYDMLQRWPLAVTAYNHGPNGIRRAVESVGSRDIADILQKHESPSFKFASKNFYSCFVAVLEIMENPGKYFKSINYKPRWMATSVKLPFAMTSNAVCKAQNITDQQFKRLNPGMRPVVFTQQRPIPAGYAVNLPDSISAEQALAAFDRTPASQRTVVAAAAPPPAPQERQRQQRNREREITREREIEMDADGYYTVVQGDNLHGIARRLGVPMNELAAANNITNSSRIYVGQVLRMPLTLSASKAAAQVDTTTIVLAGAQNADTAAQVQAQPPASETVQATPASELAQASSPEPEPEPEPEPIRIDTTAALLKPATPAFRELRVLVTAAAPHDTAASVPPSNTPKPVIIDTSVAFKEAETAPSATTTTAGKPAPDTRFDATVYDLGTTVAPGGLTVQVRVSVDETVGHLAEWMKVDAAEIRRLNNVEPNAALPLGRLISIPVKHSSNIKRFEVNRLQYHMAIEEDYFARYDITDFERRKVKSGDNLWKICSEAQIPMWLLKKFNRNIKFYDLRVGSDLWIPKTTAKDSAHEAPNVFDPTVTESDTE